MQFSTALFTVALMGALELASAPEWYVMFTLCLFKCTFTHSSKPESNTSSTQQNVNIGCILVNGQKKCNGQAPYQTSSGSAKIHALFDGGNKDNSAWSGCSKTFKWPAGYGDVYYGADVSNT